MGRSNKIPQPLSSPSSCIPPPHLALARVDTTRFAAAMALPASSSGLFRFISPRRRPQSTDIAAAATWGVFAGTAAIYLVQICVACWIGLSLLGLLCSIGYLMISAR
uniref:Uncharacterized protein n=1 Tax=Oryza meridionalis TaxID=40149 RepID=A0A0E0EG83_9ORYZ